MPRRRPRLLPAALALTLTACAPSEPPPPDPAPSTPAAYAAALEQAANTARESLDLAPLAHDSCAATAALARAEALAGAPELTHAPLTDVIATCAPVEKAAENLSRSERPPAEVVEAWLASPGHASNLKDPALARGAISCVEDGERDGLPRFLCSHVMLGGS